MIEVNIKFTGGECSVKKKFIKKFSGDREVSQTAHV
jgi:hypothetical protein